MGLISHLTPRDSGASDGTYGLYGKGDKQGFALNTVFLVFAIFVVVGRFWAQRNRKQPHVLEDVFCLIALAAYIAQAGIVYAMVLTARAYDSNKTVQQTTLYMRLIFAAQFPYGVEMGFIRASILVFQIRIFGPSRWFRWTAYGILALVFSWMIMVIVVACVICIPVNYSWNQTIPGSCGDVTASYEAIAGSGIVLDAMIFTAPMPIIWNLHTSMSRKILISMLFLIGAFDIVCGALRLDALIHGVESVFALAWAIVEPAMAIFVASAPHYPRVYNKIASWMDHTASSVSSNLRTVFQHISSKSKTRVRQSKSIDLEDY